MRLPKYLAETDNESEKRGPVGHDDTCPAPPMARSGLPSPEGYDEGLMLLTERERDRANRERETAQWPGHWAMSILGLAQSSGNEGSPQSCKVAHINYKGDCTYHVHIRQKATNTGQVFFLFIINEIVFFVFFCFFRGYNLFQASGIRTVTL